MSLRMQDFLCVSCNRRWEELIVTGENRSHCGEVAQKLIGAPAVHYKEGKKYPALGGKEASSSREVDQILAKENQYVPTAYESKQLRDLVEDPNFDPVAVGKPDSPKIAKAVDKAMDRMYSEGREMPS